MRIRGCWLAALVAALVVPAAASADTTIGNVTAPAGSTAGICPASPGQIVISLGSISSPLNPQYTVPSGPPQDVTSWQVNAGGGTPGAQVTLVVLNINFTSSTITVVGTDTETLPASLPADKIATFTPSSPIQVKAGDSIGVYINGATGITCDWSGGSVSSGDGVEGWAVASPPTAGQTVSPSFAMSASQAVGNVAATLKPVSYDAGLSLSAAPSNATVGQPALLSATVTNNGPLAGPITFTDPVPQGLTVVAATTDSGSCNTSVVRIVTCTLPNLPVGHSAKVVIVVTPTAAQTYSDTGTLTVGQGATDPNPANNSAAVSLRVSNAPTGGARRCVVPKLRGTSAALARRLLGLLGCKLGKVKQTQSKSVAKGFVIGTSPGAGSYAANKVVALKVSSGPAKPHKTGRR
jgi:uncharacterized repeat protein (TIGR01451 family)